MQTRNNKTVLLVAYYFPPMGMGGVGRPYALFRYLPDYGYNVIVLTVKDILYPQYDYSLLNEGDKSCIYRTGSLDPARLLYKLGVKRQSRSGFPDMSRKLPLYFPDLKRGWVYFAYRRLSKIIKENNISAVISTAPPPSVHLLGLKLKKISKIPWVADFRDFWFPLPIEMIYPDGLARRYSLRLKDKIIRQADEVVSVNNDIKKYFGRGEVIMNGADQTVVEAWRKHQQSKNRQLIIGAFGTFNYLFPIEPLFRAVRTIIDNKNLSEKDIRIVQVGHTDTELIRLIDKYSLKDIVELKGYFDRVKAIEILTDVDLLYLGVNRFENYNILPGRAFDCLVSGKPIIGVVPAGSDIAALIEKYHSGTVITDNDTGKLAASLMAISNKKNSAADFDLTPTSSVEEYTMPTLARKYATVLDKLLK